MCFSKQNANDFIEALDEVIDEMGPEELEVKVTAWIKCKKRESKVLIFILFGKSYNETNVV